MRRNCCSATSIPAAVQRRLISPSRHAIELALEQLEFYEVSDNLRIDDDAAVAVTTFIDDDDGYLVWLANHPHGYVLNAERETRASYLKLQDLPVTSVVRRR